MKKHIVISLSIWIWICSCNDPVSVGSDLLADQSLVVEFVDDIPLVAETVMGQPSLTYRNLGNNAFVPSNYMVGIIDDGVFGRSEAITYVRSELSSTVPEFTSSNLDSVVLSIPLDSLGFYGDPNAIHDIEVRLLAEPFELETDQSIFSDSLLATGDIIGTKTTTLNFRDSITVDAYLTNIPDSVIQIRNELRITLDNDFFLDMLETGISNSDYQNIIPGFAIRSTPSTNSVVGLDFEFNDITLTASSSIQFYFVQDEANDIRAIYTIPVGSIRHSTFDHDYTGSIVGESLNGGSADDIHYIQSMAGTDVAIDISEIRTLRDQIINSATLQVVVEPEADEAQFSPVEAIFAFARTNEGVLSLAGSPVDINNPLQEVFVGADRILSYSLDVTEYLTQFKMGDIESDSLLIAAASKSQRANRSIIYGSSHPDFPLRLDLVITNPQ